MTIVAVTEKGKTTTADTETNTPLYIKEKATLYKWPFCVLTQGRLTSYLLLNSVSFIMSCGLLKSILFSFIKASI
jgi:hypothetical protein